MRKQSGDALLDLAAVQAIAGGLSESSIRRLMAVGDFPRPVVLSRRSNGIPGRVAWSEQAVREWASEKIREAATEALL